MTNTRSANRAGRRIVLVGIENLVGTATPTSDEVERIMAALGEVMRGFSEAHVVVACSHRAAAAVAFARPTARHLWRSGPDGADMALLDVLDTEHIEERFAHVIICSGDGIFVSAAARLATCGVSTTVVALRGHLAARLELAAQRVIRLRPMMTHMIPTGSAS